MTISKLFIFTGLLFLLLNTSGCESQTEPPVSTNETMEKAVAPEQESKTTEPISSENPANSRKPGDPLPTIRSASTPEDGYQEIQWEDLMPSDFHPEAILAKYEKELEQLEQLDDGDPKAMEIYGMIQAEMDNAPVNQALHGKKIKLPGFIAPLENREDKVTEFLLVPYYGACIHVPPPPINQTVMVKTQSGEGIPASEAYLPYWIKGVITTEAESTSIGSAGYRIEEASTEEFD